MDLAEEAEALLPDLIALRRKLHAAPEVGLHLPETQQTVLKALTDLDLEITLGKATSSVVAVLRGGRPGPCILLRGDMDALPIREETGLEFASANGRMHACGHDLHTAGLIGAARLLAAHRDALAGDVIFMFQPGEEGFGGAKIMIDEGVLGIAGPRPIAAYAIHIMPGERGCFSTMPGTVMAGSNILRITVQGSGGHGSQPQGSIDPIPPLAEIVTGLQTMTTRQFSVFDPVVLSVTQLEAGGAVNVIADTASLGATVRALSPEAVQKLVKSTKILATGIASAHGCTAEVDFEIQYPVTVNDTEITTETITVLQQTFGPERFLPMAHARMGSEDFAFVLDQIPGTFIWLAATPDGVDPKGSSNHSSRVQFDDVVLADQAVAFARLALTKLAPAHRANIDIDIPDNNAKPKSGVSQEIPLRSHEPLLDRAIQTDQIPSLNSSPRRA